MRYSKPELTLGKEAINKLQNRTIAIVGVGAIGSVSAELLARNGVNLILIDRDLVEESNLNRQSLYVENDVGKIKVNVAKKRLREINSKIKIESHATSLDNSNLSLLDKADLVLDGTDNFETRYVLDRHNKKWVYAAAVGTQGMISPIIDIKFKNIFAKKTKPLSCDDEGIINITSHLTAVKQVSLAIQILLGRKIEPHITVFDIFGEEQKIKINKIKEKAEKKEEKQFSFKIDKCKTRAAYSAKTNKQIKLDFKKLKKQYKVLIDTPIVLVIKEQGIEIIVHRHGELVFKKFYDENKIKEIAEKIYENR